MTKLFVDVNVKRAERTLERSIRTYYNGEASLHKVEKAAVKLHCLKLIKKLSKHAKN